MTLKKAESIINDNYHMIDGSFTLLMYDECEFSEKDFDNFCEAISVITKTGKKSEELTQRLTWVYQFILKEIIAHFDPRDIVRLKHFSENYYNYIDKLENALVAYFETTSC